MMSLARENYNKKIGHMLNRVREDNNIRRRNMRLKFWLFENNMIFLNMRMIMLNRILTI